MTIEMEKMMKSKFTKADLRTKVLQSLGFDITVDQKENPYKIDTNERISDDILDDGFIDLSFNDDYEKLNFIPNDDNPVDLDAQYDVILTKYKDDPYALTIYYVEIYPNVKNEFAEYLKDLYNERYNIIINSLTNIDLRKQLYTIIRNLNNILIMLLYDFSNYILEKAQSDNQVECSDINLIDSYFDIVEDNKYAIKLAYYTNYVLNNPDTVNLSKYKELVQQIKNQTKQFIIDEFIQFNTNSNILMMIKELQSIDDIDLKVELFSIISVLLKRNK